MKDIFESLLKLLPQPLVLAFLVTGGVYFAIYYHFSDRYRSYGDAFRDEKFRSAAVIVFAIALLYLINHREAGTQVPDQSSPILIVTQLSKDTDDQYRSVLTADIASRLTRVLGTPMDVLRIRAFVSDERSARQTLKDYGALAILFDASVSEIDGGNLLCMKLITGSDGPLCLAPFKWTERDSSLDRIANAVADHASRSAADLSNPLVTRLRNIEERLAQLTAATENSPAASTFREDFPQYGNKYAILVGIDKVAGIDSQLSSSKSDATDLDRVLRETFGFQSQLLLDSAATTGALMAAIQTIADKATADDILIFYFVGYGSEIPSDEAPRNMSATLFPFDSAKTNGVRTSDVVAAISKVPCKHKVAIADTCHATSGLSGLPANTAVTRPDADVFYFIGSCRGDQVSIEGKDGFTQVLIRTLAELSDRKGVWIREAMSRVQGNMQGTQTPQLLRLEGTGDAAFVKS